MKKILFFLSLCTIGLLWANQSKFNLNKDDFWNEIRQSIPFFMAPGDFTFTTNITDQTCSGNGAMEIIVNDANIDGTYSLEVFLSTNMSSPVRVTSIVAASTTFSHLFSGLNNGDYIVRVTESFDGVTSVKNSNVTILNDYEVLIFTAKQTRTCVDNIEVTVTNGTALTYELRTTSGTIIRPEQSSNLFENVPIGNYRVYVKDSCGEIVTQDIVVSVLSNTTDLINRSPSINNSCDTYNGSFEIKHSNPSVLMQYPITYLIEFSNGSPSINGVVNLGGTAGLNGATVDYLYPISSSNYTVTITAVDACSNVKTGTFNVNSPITKSANMSVTNSACGQYASLSGNISYPATINFTSYPPSFIPSDYNPNFIGNSYSGTINNLQEGKFGANDNSLPIGNYVGTIEDNCGELFNFNFSISTASPININYIEGPGCELGESIVSLYSNITGFAFDTFTITSAPPTYTGSTNIVLDDFGYYNFSNATPGTYTVVGTYQCEGVTQTVSRTFNIVGLTRSVANVTINEGCGSWTFDLEYSSNEIVTYFSIEKFNEISGQWEFGAETNFFLFDMDGNTNTEEYISGTDGSFSLIGKLRIVADSGNCKFVLKEFEIDPDGMVLTPYVFNCSPGTITIGLNTSGVGPFNYKLTEFNGSPINVDNGDNPVFAGINPGTYKVEVENGCGETRNVTVSADAVQIPKITPSNLCEGENGTLNLPELSFMNVTWTRNGGPLPADVTTTNNGYTLNFSPYNKANHVGNYVATLTYKTPNSCAPVVVSYNLTATNDVNPEAGTGKIVYVDPTTLTAPIDLFNYIDGYYDTGGTWSETTNPASGLLLGNYFNAVSLSSGTYTFQYSVDGTCSGNDTTIVTVVLSSLELEPDMGSASAGQNSTAVDNVLENDTFNGVTSPSIGTYPGQIELFTVNSDDLGITLDPLTGAVNVSDTVLPGTYILEYQACVVGSDPLLCKTEIVTITVTEGLILDPETVSTPFGTPASVNVVDGDLLDGTQVVIGTDPGQITVSEVGSWPTGISLDPITGEVSIDGTLTSGIYEVDYQVCVNDTTPAQCATETVTINVTDVLIATDDEANFTAGNTSIAIANVVNNDELNENIPVIGTNPGEVTLSYVTGATPPAGISFNLTDGSVTVDGSVLPGIYVFEYEVCVNGANPAVCDIAEVTITVTEGLILDPETVSTPFGTPASVNVVDGDLLDGTQVVIGTDPGQITVSEVGSWPTGISLDPITGEVSIDGTLTSGIYEVDYQVCVNDTTPAQCATETVTIQVTDVLITSPDLEIVESGATIIAIPNVVTNDLLNGNIPFIGINSGEVTVSQSGVWPAGFTFDTTIGSVTIDETVLPGTYSMEYQICVNGSNPQICEIETIEITVIQGACVKPGNFDDTGLATNIGISAVRSGNDSNWPQVREGGWIALESNTKGFVPNRLTNSQIQQIPVTDLVIGMMVYNVDEDCLQINVDGTATGWNCFKTPACPD